MNPIRATAETSSPLGRLLRRAALAAAVAIGAAAAAPEAAAHPIRPAIEFATEGGLVIYNYRLQIYPSGFTVAIVTRPREPGEALLLTDYIRPSAVTALQNGFLRAKIHSVAPTVRRDPAIADVPDQVVRVFGKRVRLTGMGSPRDPIASQLFIRAMNEVARHFARIANEPLAGYDVRNGMQGLEQNLEISRSGAARLHRTVPFDRPYLKEANVSIASVNELKRSLSKARFWALPPSFIPNPPPPFAGSVRDVTAYDLFDRSKTVHTMDGATLPRDFQAVVNHLDRIVQEVEQR